MLYFTEELMAKKPPAECLALIICESVVEDARSHNKCILNTYNEIHAVEFPMKQDRLTIFMSFTNGHGTSPISVRICQDQRNEPVAKFDGEVKFASPLDVAEIVFDLRGMPFPNPGMYSVQVWLGETQVAARRIEAKLGTKGKQHGR